MKAHTGVRCDFVSCLRVSYSRPPRHQQQTLRKIRKVGEAATITVTETKTTKSYVIGQSQMLPVLGAAFNAYEKMSPF